MTEREYMDLLLELNVPGHRTLQVHWIDRGLAIVSTWSQKQQRFIALRANDRTHYACGDIPPRYPVPAKITDQTQLALCWFVDFNEIRKWLGYPAMYVF